MKTYLLLFVFFFSLNLFGKENRLDDVVSESFRTYLDSMKALEEKRKQFIDVDPDDVQFVEDTLIEFYRHYWDMIPTEKQNSWIGEWYLESVRNRITRRTLRKGFRHLPLMNADPEVLEYMANSLLERMGESDEYFGEGIEFVLSGGISEEEYRQYKKDLIEFGSYIGNRLYEEILGRKIYIQLPRYMEKERVSNFKAMTRGAGEDEKSQKALQEWRVVFGIPENMEAEMFKEDHPILVKKFIASKLVGDHLTALSEHFNFSPETETDSVLKQFLEPYVSLNVRNQITESFSYIVLSLSIFEAEHLSRNIRSLDKAKELANRAFDAIDEDIYIRDFSSFHGAAVNFYSFIFENKRQGKFFQKGSGQYDLIYSPNSYD